MKHCFLASVITLTVLGSCRSNGNDSEFRSAIRLWQVHQTSETVEGQLIDAFKKYPGACDEVWLLAGQMNHELIAEEELATLKKAADDFRKLGITVSYQDISIGHPDNLLVGSCAESNKYGFRAAIGMYGEVTYSQTCPRDTAFAESFARKYAQIAQAIHPDNIMIDDDLRLTQHSPASCICFCDSCIAQFNKEYNHSYSRIELREALDSNAEGIRRQWIEFSQNSLAHFAGRVAEQVHKVSPETHLGLQHAAFHTNLMEGWDWNKIFDAMRQATLNPVSSRPGHGVYNDHAPRLIIGKAYGISRQIARLEGDFHMIYPEIEGYQHRATGKSPQAVCTETLLYLSMGANAMSYALICGNNEPMEWYADNYFKYLDRYHNLFSRYVSFNKGTEGAGIDDYISPSLVYRDDENWKKTDSGNTSAILSPLGVPFTPEARLCTASVLDALNISAMSAEEIEAFLNGHNAVIDIRGWKEITGKGLQSLLKPTEAPEGLPDGAGCFTTEGGKRVVVLGKTFNYDISSSQRKQLLRAFDWASYGKMYVVPETFSQCVVVPRADSGNGNLRSVTYVNATITDQENISLRLRSCPDKARFFWEDVEGSHRLREFRDGGDAIVTIPFVKAWDAGWIRIKQ